MVWYIRKNKKERKIKVKQIVTECSKEPNGTKCNKGCSLPMTIPKPIHIAIDLI
jgi:hypothetical protein